MNTVPTIRMATQSHSASVWHVPMPHPSSERSRSTMSSGRDAGDATTVVAAKVVATVGIERWSAPSRASGARAARNAQAIVATESMAAIAIESGKRSANDRVTTIGKRTSTAVSDAQ